MLQTYTLSSASLPLIGALPDCANFSTTVQPFLPQLYGLPGELTKRGADLQALQELYLASNPLVTALAFAILLTPVVFFVAEANRNYSQVDRLWSILPAVYNIHYATWARLNGMPSLKLDHVMAVSVIWGARLTFNYWRKGGYQVGSEDYRWNIVKDYIGPAPMFFFNIVFISFAQNILLWLITTPTYILLLTSRISRNELSSYDSIFSKSMLLIVVVEYFADQQQWNYHQAKSIYQKTAKVPTEYKFSRDQLERGFNTSGLWAWSRHPNFAAEQAFWVFLYQWCCLESWTYVNWTVTGAVAYLILFQASTWLTELLSSRKYPYYKTYQARVGKFLPKTTTTSIDALKNHLE